MKETYRPPSKNNFIDETKCSFSVVDCLQDRIKSLENQLNEKQEALGL